jgi:HSP20 family molecular chaperone IbpA
MTTQEHTSTGRIAGWLSRLEDSVEDQTYVIRAEIPGVDPEKDLDIHVEGDLLVVKGEHREETQDEQRREVTYGAFERTVRLPGGVEPGEVSATYKDGVLEVRAPYHPDAVPARRIQVPVQRTAIEEE